MSIPARATIAALTLASFAAAAQPVTTTQFPGTARIGTATRNVTFHFSCALDRGKINNLATDIDVPDTPELKHVFDFDPFEGPIGHSAKAHLVATAGNATSTMELGYTGSYGTNGAPDSTFTFSAAFGTLPSEKPGLQRLQAIVATLGSGPSHLSATIANFRKGGPAIEASADLSDTQAAQIRSALAPCGGRH